jgi:hypothetical protein
LRRITFAVPTKKMEPLEKSAAAPPDSKVNVCDFCSLIAAPFVRSVGVGAV